MVWDERGAAIVLRVDEPKALPEGIFSDEESIVFLKGGAFVMDGGDFGKGSEKKALEAIADAFLVGREPLGFHQDRRGVRWVKVGKLFDAPSREIEVPGSGTFRALDVDYESVVAQPGVWVSVEAVYARIAEERDVKPSSKPAIDAHAGAESTDDPEDGGEEPEADEDREVRNVVVVRKAPKKRPKEIEVLGTLEDGTLLVVGPKSKGWVDALKKDPGPSALRLIRGPIALGELLELSGFGELDLAMRAKGTPMLVMPGG